jgi:adenylate kinase
MLGAPGAGKGTQAKKIAAKYNIPHIATGDIFRANLKEGTELGKKAKSYMEQGLLVPDELVVDIVVDRLKECENGYVLDGFPRTIPQAEAHTAILNKIGKKLDYVLEFDVPDENIINRMAGRRACINCGATYHTEFNPPKTEDVCDVCGNKLVLRYDDAPETVKKRLEIYHEQTQPLIDFYSNSDVLRTIDGTLEIDEVFQNIVKILGE